VAYNKDDVIIFIVAYSKDDVIIFIVAYNKDDDIIFIVAYNKDDVIPYSCLTCKVMCIVFLLKTNSQLYFPVFQEECVMTSYHDHDDDVITHS